MRKAARTQKEAPEHAPNSVVDFGAEVRQLRRTRRMTLAELAQISGVSLSHLSAIERGAVNPSVDKVAKIAEALNVPVGWFFTPRPGDGPLERAHVVRQNQRRQLNQLYGEGASNGFSIDYLLSSTIGGDWHLGIAEYEPGAAAPKDQLYARAGDIHAYVLQGTLELQLGDEIIALSEGDSFSFSGEIPHAVRNVSNEFARLLFADSRVIIPAQSRISELSSYSQSEDT